MTTRKVTPRGTCCSLRPCLQLLQLHSHVHKPHLIDVHPHPQNGTVIGAQTAELRHVVSPGPGGSKPGERMFKLCRTEGLLRFSVPGALASCRRPSRRCSGRLLVGGMTSTKVHGSSITISTSSALVDLEAPPLVSRAKAFASRTCR